MLVKMLTCHSGPTITLVPGKVYDLPEAIAKRFIEAKEATAVAPARDHPFKPTPRHPLKDAPPEYKSTADSAEKGKPVETAVVRTQENTAMRVKKPTFKKSPPAVPTPDGSVGAGK